MNTNGQTSKTKKWVMYVVVINLFIVALAFSFCLGMRYASCDINKISEVHYLEPKFVSQHRLMHSSLSELFTKILKDSLKYIRPPYTDKKINNLIDHIWPQYKDKNFVRLVGTDSTYYQILITNGYQDGHLSYLTLLNPDGEYFLKPLKVVRDLKPAQH